MSRWNGDSGDRKVVLLPVGIKVTPEPTPAPSRASGITAWLIIAGLLGACLAFWSLAIYGLYRLVFG